MPQVFNRWAIQFASIARDDRLQQAGVWMESAAIGQTAPVELGLSGGDGELRTIWGLRKSCSLPECIPLVPIVEPSAISEELAWDPPLLIVTSRILIIGHVHSRSLVSLLSARVLLGLLLVLDALRAPGNRRAPSTCRG